MTRLLGNTDLYATEREVHVMLWWVWGWGVGGAML